jgi:hypothetical protein
VLVAILVSKTCSFGELQQDISMLVAMVLAMLLVVRRRCWCATIADVLLHCCRSCDVVLWM